VQTPFDSSKTPETRPQPGAGLPLMQRVPSGVSTTLKMFLIGALVLLLMIPLTMIRVVLYERMGNRDSAEAEVTEGWGARQTVSPPFLSVLANNEITEEIDEKIRKRNEQFHHALLPDRVLASANLAVTTRTVASIYEMPVYVATVKFSGAFSAEDLAKLRAQSGLDINSLQFEFLASDLRGIGEIKRFQINGIELNPASLGNAFGRQSALGANVGLPNDATRSLDILNATKAVPFELEYTLRGVQSFHTLPLARSLRLKMQSSWPHPKFIGGLLPIERKVADNGFDASWQVSEFNRDFPQLTSRLTDSSGLENATLGVGLMQMNDVYQRNDRAGKYGFLFLALSIAGFFLVEVLLKVRLHPMHYLQIGLALGLFYLLLLALSERTGFNQAFLISAGVITLLIAAYAGAIMRAKKRGALAGAIIGGTYGFLFMLIAGEQYSLLLGACGLLVILALIMYLTRHLNWYGQNGDARPER
jgi:inner membrane protein